MDAEFVAKARDGDREAFAIVATGAVDRLYAVARLILRDADLAEDAVQEALIRAWRDLPTLRDVERFDAWSRRLLVHACIDIGRRRRRWRAELTAIGPEPSEPDRASELADRDELERALQTLTDPQRAILVLRFHLGLTLREVAESLDIPFGTAKSRLHYGLDALRAALDADARSTTVTAVKGRPA